MNNDQNKGFTLIEMMITVAIIGILAAVAIPNYNKYIEKGQLTVAKTYLTSMRQQIEIEYLKTGKRDKLPDASASGVANYQEYTLHFENPSFANEKLTAERKGSRFESTISVNIRTGKFSCPTDPNSICKSILP